MDVKYIPSDWEKIRSGLGDLVGLGRWGKGMIDELKDITENMEDAASDIAEYDSDGVISFSHIDRESTYQKLYEDFQVMHDFTGKVGDIVDRTMDQPFYEDIDAFVSAMKEATISNYTTKNRIGATEEQITYHGYGAMHTTREVPKTEVSLDDLFSGDTFYGEQMQIEYEMWKAEHPDQDFTQEEYQMAAVNMNAFEYESIKDQQLNKEFWVNIGALVVVVGVAVVCPPAGLALGAAYGSLELGSAISGKDWSSGRELDTGERWMRGALAPLDIIPGVAGIKKFSSGVRIANQAADIGQFGLTSGIKSSMQQELKHVGDMVTTAGKHSASRLKHAGAVVIAKVAKDATAIAKAADAGIISAKNLTSTRKTIALDQVGKVTMPAENTHHFAKKMEEPVSKTDVGKVGGDTLNKNAIRFTNLDEANEWGNLYYNDWITSLSESEKEAIKRYTGNDYRKINNYLRGVSDSLEGLDIQVIDNITSGLDKAYVPRNLKVYRGTDLKPFIDLYKLNDEGEVIVDSLIGKTIKDDGFTSTAMVRESSFGHMNVSWEINVPEGSNAAYIGGISHYPNEAELLLNAGQEMVIKQATVNSDGKIHLVLDLLK